MATRIISVIALLAAVMVVATVACAGDPASDIDATIGAGIAATMAPFLAKEHKKTGGDLHGLG